MQDYKKLEAWQKSHAIALRTYAITANFPKSELFGLTAQMRRAAVSMPANIAEGCYRGQRSFAHSLQVALGSAGELEYFITLSTDLELLPQPDGKTFAGEMSDVKAVITGLLKSVKASIEAEKQAQTRQPATSNQQTANGKRQTANGKR